MRRQGGGVVGAALSVIVVASGAAQPLTAPPRLSDAAYLAAVRCAGLAEVAGVGAPRLGALVQGQQAGRDRYVRAKADAVRRDAVREGRRVTGAEAQRLAAELAGFCRGLPGLA